MKRQCLYYIALLFLSCSAGHDGKLERQTQSLAMALETLKTNKLTDSTTHVLIVTLQGCGGCTSQVLAHYKQMVTSTWLVVFCANDPVIVRSFLNSYGIDKAHVLVDTKNIMIKNSLVDHAPVVFRVKNKRIVHRYDFDLENFAKSIEHVKADN